MTQFLTLFSGPIQQHQDLPSRIKGQMVPSVWKARIAFVCFVATYLEIFRIKRSNRSLIAMQTGKGNSKARKDHQAP